MIFVISLKWFLNCCSLIDYYILRFKGTIEITLRWIYDKNRRYMTLYIINSYQIHLIGNENIYNIYLYYMYMQYLYIHLYIHYFK